MESYKYDTPDKFARYRDHLVFIFEKKISDENISEFKNQFANELINDLHFPPASVERALETAHLDYLGFFGEFNQYRVEVTDGAILSEKWVERFPDSWFFRNGYEYDSEGKLTFGNGVYDTSGLDQLSDTTTNYFMSYDHWDYIMSEGLPYGKIDAGATMTIGMEGKVISVEIVPGIKNAPTQSLMDRYKEALLRMPPWRKRTVNGKPVCYRLRLEI